MSYSQDQVRKALAEIDGLMVYKLPDDARNWKPADFTLWWGGSFGAENVISFDEPVRSAFLEVKMNPLIGVWNVMGKGSDSLSPVQVRACLAAERIGLPYHVAVYWPKKRYWTLHSRPGRLGFPGRMTFTEATTKWGVGTAPANLTLTLRSVLNGEAGL